MTDANREPEQPTGPTVRDRRRIDPDTFQVREPVVTAAPAEGGQVTDEVAGLQIAVAERTADLQRLQAEYVNYKRRVDRDRDLVRTLAVESVLRDLLSALDDIRSAREHGEFTGGFKAVGEEIERITGKHGLVAYGEKGDPFDPHIHEALLHAHAEGITGPTCVEVLQPGYRVGDRILRPARVAVAEPATAPEVAAPEVAAPEVAAPEIAAPEVAAPEAAADVPAADVPAAEVPAADPPAGDPV